MTEKNIPKKTLLVQNHEDDLIIADEIIKCFRPRNWNTAGHPDHSVWAALEKRRELLREQQPAMSPVKK